MDLLNKINGQDVRALARAITIVENELDGSDAFLRSLPFNRNVPIIGITGPPGAGKSTLVNSLITHITTLGKKVAVIAIDPTSPFNYGSILGDRIRMAEHFNNPNVFIRSLATRGSLGGLSAKTIEICDVLKNAWFDFVIVETVGVGQSEVEIVGLSDTTVLVLIPEAGDEVQSIKSGIMEIADVFVVNKSDRPGADLYARNIISMLHEKSQSSWTPSVIKVIASQNIGVNELFAKILEHQACATNSHKTYLFTEKAFRLIQAKRTKDIQKQILKTEIEILISKGQFNLYQYVAGK